MTAAVLVAEDEGPRRGAPFVEARFVDALVARLHDEYGADPGNLRAEVQAALATFTAARVQTFVPVLVEKRVREACRDRRAARR